jgi:hypothetical protein
MKNISVIFTSIFAVAGLVASTQATIITFDDLGDTPTGLYIPDGYSGLNWADMWELDGETINAYYGISASGYANGVVSPNNVAYNYNGYNASASSATPFNLVSGYFTGAFNNNLNLQVLGYNGATLLYNQTYIVNVTGPSYVLLNMNNITKVTFSSSGGYNAGLSYGSGTQFVLDNLTINFVPEPSTWTLFLVAGFIIYPTIRNFGKAARQ